MSRHNPTSAILTQIVNMEGETNNSETRLHRNRFKHLSVEIAR